MARSHDDFVDMVKIKNPSVEIVGTYTKAQDRIAVRCKECGYEWTPKAYSLTQGRSCPHCSAKRGAKNNSGKTGLKTQERFLSEMSKVHPTIKVVGEYLNGHTDVQCICSVCGHSWKAKPYSLLQGHGCPRCAKSGTSFMEQFIKGSFEVALGEDSVLSRDKTAIGMELDIYIPSLKIAIEPGNWFLHKKSLNRDKTKRARCKEKNIRLITIYDKFPITEQIPFGNDCFVFSDDLNKADHRVIKNLVKKLFEIANIQCELSESQWSTIERQAYDDAKAKTHEDFVESMKTLHPTIEVLGKYVNSNKRLLVKCTVCGFEWNGVPASMLAGDGCRKCGTKLAHKNFVKKQDEFEKQVQKANPDIKVIGVYTGRHNPIQAKCKICGYIWNPKASSLLRGSNHRGWKTIHKNYCDGENKMFEIIDFTKPVDSKLHSKYNEQLSLLLLNHLSPEASSKFILSDAPDLQVVDKSVGIEVTEAVSQKNSIIDGEYAKLRFGKKSEREKEKCKQSIEENGGEVDLTGILYPVTDSGEERQLFCKAFKKKLELLPSYKSKGFKKMGLFILFNGIPVWFKHEVNMNEFAEFQKNSADQYDFLLVGYYGAVVFYDFHNMTYDKYIIKQDTFQDLSSLARKLVEEKFSM